MKYFIVPDENTHYFYMRGRGICRRRMLFKNEPEQIFTGGTDDFSVMNDGAVHIICTNEKNEVFYIKNKSEPVKIISCKDDVKPYDFQLYKGYNLFYKTNYEDKTLLFFCQLGVSDKPVLIDYIYPDSSFDFGGGKVFYTDSAKNLVSRCISSGEKQVVAENAFMPCYTIINSSEYLLYKKDGSIILNNRCIAFDENAEQPVIFRTGSYTYVQWKSGGFVRYMTISANGTCSGIKRYIGTGKEPVLIDVLCKDGSYKCYGYEGSPFNTVTRRASGEGVVKESIYDELADLKKQVYALREEMNKQFNSSL